MTPGDGDDGSDGDDPGPVDGPPSPGPFGPREDGVPDDAPAPGPVTFDDACEALLSDPGGEHSTETTLAPLADRARGVDPQRYAAWADLVTAACPPEADAVLHLGCGAGGLLSALERSFGEVVAVDAREALLRQAARRSARSVLVAGDPAQADLARPFDAVVAVDDAAGAPGRGDAAALFENCHRHLCPGGILVCDAVADARALRADSVRVMRDDVYRLEVAVDVADAGDRLDVVRDFRVTDRLDGRRATTSERRSVDLLDADGLRAALSSAGFAGIEVDERAGPAGLVVATAHRPVRTR